MNTILVTEEYLIKSEGDCRGCGCNAILESRIGFPVKMLCYPFKSIVTDYKPCKFCLKRRESNNRKEEVDLFNFDCSKKETSKKIIYENTYGGFEDLYDLGRDIHECFDPAYNPLVKDLPEEFTGTVTVTITYEEES